MAVTIHTKDRVAIVTLDRPEKLNAMDASHLKEMRTHLANASTDPDVSVIVLTGAGEKSFCVGADLTANSSDEVPTAEAYGLDRDQAAKRGYYIRLFDLSPLEIKKPLIAAVNGFCLGGGLELALQCDFIVASENAVFGLPEVTVASLPGAGGVANLLGSIPKGAAMKLVLTGERINAQQALQFGLVTDVWPIDKLADGVSQIANRIAANGPLAVRLVKLLASHSSKKGDQQAFQMAEFAWSVLRDSEDRREGRQAFAEKRKPRYQSR